MGARKARVFVSIVIFTNIVMSKARHAPSGLDESLGLRFPAPTIVEGIRAVVLGSLQVSRASRTLPKPGFVHAVVRS